MKIDCAVYLNNIKVHCAHWNDSAPILAKPTLKIESIGIDENIHTSNNVRIIDLSNNLNAELIGGGTITNTEFSYLDGLTGNIQSQLNLKHSTIDSTTNLNTKDLSANNAKIHDLSVNKINIISIWILYFNSISNLNITIEFNATSGIDSDITTATRC